MDNLEMRFIQTRNTELRLNLTSKKTFNNIIKIVALQTYRNGKQWGKRLGLKAGNCSLCSQFPIFPPGLQKSPEPEIRFLRIHKGFSYSTHFSTVTVHVHFGVRDLLSTGFSQYFYNLVQEEPKISAFHSLTGHRVQGKFFQVPHRAPWKRWMTQQISATLSSRPIDQSGREIMWWKSEKTCSFPPASLPFLLTPATLGLHALIQPSISLTLPWELSFQESRKRTHSSNVLTHIHVPDLWPESQRPFIWTFLLILPPALNCNYPITSLSVIL